MLILCRDQTGASVILNTDQVLFIGQACDQAKRPVLGQSVAVFVGGQVCALKGTPEELYGQLRKREIPGVNGVSDVRQLPVQPEEIKGPAVVRKLGE